MPLFGRYNFGLTVHPNGYISTNLADCGFSFFISEDDAQSLIETYRNKDQNSLKAVLITENGFFG